MSRQKSPCQVSPNKCHPPLLVALPPSPAWGKSDLQDVLEPSIPSIPQPPAGLSLERSQSGTPRLAMVCASLPRLATKLMLFWMLEENFSLSFLNLLITEDLGVKALTALRSLGFFFSHSLAFFPPIGTGTIYSRGGPSLQLINLSLACGLKRDTMPLSKARLAQKPMQNHHQILLEVENIS